MNTRTRCLLTIYVLVAAVFIYVVLQNQTGYADSWILQDIFIPTILFVLTFSIVVVTVDDNRVAALVSASFILILNAIPNLKYELFYGVFDAEAHYGTARNLLALGFVPTTGYYAPTYSDFPGIHIFPAWLSLVLGTSINVSTKILTSTIFSIIPLMIYFATNGIFEKDVQKYVIAASGLLTVTSYDLTGTVFALPLYFSIFCIFLKKIATGKNGREYTVVLIMFFVSLLFSHAVTTMAVVVTMGIALFLMKFVDLIKRGSFHFSISRFIGTWLLLAVPFVAWLMFKADFIFETFTASVQRMFFREAYKAPIPTRFFQIPLFAELRILAVYYLGDAIVLILAFAGLSVLLIKSRQKFRHVLTSFYLPLMSIVVAASSLLVLLMVTQFGDIEYDRFVSYTVVFGAFMVGLLFWHLDHHLTIRFKRTWIRYICVSFLLFLSISLSLIEIFPCQPLVPGANVLSNNLPSSTYLEDLRGLNTIYQESMILFAQRFSSNTSLIGSDTVTGWQILAFGNESLASKYVNFDPLNPTTNQTGNVWDIILLDYGGKSGPLNEKAENRTPEAIQNLRDTLGNTIYDNGESFILEH